MTEATQSPLPEPGLMARSLRVLSGNRTGVIGFVLVALIVGSAIFAPWIVPYDPTAIMTGPRMAPPSAEHWLGTDNIGRDIFSRVIAGGRIAMLGIPTEEMAIDWNTVVFNMLTIKGIYGR